MIAFSFSKTQGRIQITGIDQANNVCGVALLEEGLQGVKVTFYLRKSRVAHYTMLPRNKEREK